MKARVIALGIAVAAAALVQGCAPMTTGGFAPSRAPSTNNSMLLNYNMYGQRVSRIQNTPHSTMTVTHESDLHGYKYY